MTKEQIKEISKNVANELKPAKNQKLEKKGEEEPSQPNQQKSPGLVAITGDLSTWNFPANDRVLEDSAKNLGKSCGWSLSPVKLNYTTANGYMDQLKDLKELTLDTEKPIVAFIHLLSENMVPTDWVATLTFIRKIKEFNVSKHIAILPLAIDRGDDNASKLILASRISYATCLMSDNMLGLIDITPMSTKKSLTPLNLLKEVFSLSKQFLESPKNVKPITEFTGLEFTSVKEKEKIYGNSRGKEVRGRANTIQ